MRFLSGIRLMTNCDHYVLECRNNFIAYYNIITVDGLAAEAAASTHSHSLGYMPAAVLAHIINRMV